MSSPLASLKKSSRAPLPLTGRKNVPFRQSNYSESENDLLEEITSNMAASRLKDTMVKDRKTIKANTNSREDDDKHLLSLMTSRLTSLEKRLQLQSQEIIDKDKKIRILEEKVKILQRVKDDSGPSKVRELEDKCLSLQNQVYDMEKFLEDYGMIWIGESNEADQNDSDESLISARNKDTWQPNDSIPDDSQISSAIDYDLILKNIAELNVIAGEGIAQIKRMSGGAQFQLPDPVPLILYANGILLYAGPFRPFTEPTTVQFVQDILDGYFPSELQSRYPDGTPFKVTDKRNVVFEHRQPMIFAGAGQRLSSGYKAITSSRDTGNRGSLTSSHDNDASSQPSHTKQNYKTESKLPGQQMTVQQFLSTLPASVMRNGSVIDVRNSVGEVLKGSEGKTSVIVAETTAVKDMQARIQQSDSPKADSSKITTLRVKAEDGNQTVIVKMHFHETIAKLREYLIRTSAFPLGNFEIISTFPNRAYNDDSATLESCGLIPNATLHLKRIK